jgi:hypothetical protein
MLLWRMRAGAQPDLEMHLAGATVAYLMFGLRLGGVALACAALGAGLAAEPAPFLDRTVGHWTAVYRLYRL